VSAFAVHRYDATDDTMILQREDCSVSENSIATGKAFYERQLDFLVRKDVDGLIEQQYTPDAVLISFDQVVSGRDALKAHFRAYLETLGHLVVKSTDKFVAAGNAIFFEATVASDLGEARVYDAWVLRDGKIARHFTGVK
jgi:hypothetical protein